MYGAAAAKTFAKFAYSHKNLKKLKQHIKAKYNELPWTQGKKTEEWLIAFCFEKVQTLYDRLFNVPQQDFVKTLAEKH